MSSNGQDSGTSGLTVLLNRMQSGDRPAGEQAIAMVYDELHRIASRQLRSERSDHILQATALIHEAYARLMGSESIQIQSRVHFFVIASRQMRRILVDQARVRDAARRGGGAVPVDLETVQLGVDPRSTDLLLLEAALQEFEKVYPRAAQIVELRYFGGYTDKEITEIVSVSFSTVRRDWEFARAWLFERMHGKPNPC